MDTIRWGIMSTGLIAEAFATALNSMDDAQIVAVGSRNQATADAFGEKYNIPRRYDSYEALVADADVDVIYIGTPHMFHYDNMLLCLNAGKHVLCEKAFTINARQAEECIQLARQKNLFLMEAMWMRYIPAVVQARQWVRDGRIGDVRVVRANFNPYMDFDAEHRVFNPALGGGALLDIGIYPISFATMVLGLPADVKSIVTLGELGTDEITSMLFHYEDGAQAVLTCGWQAYDDFEAMIVGTQGRIKLHHPFFFTEQLTLTMRDDEGEHHTIPHGTVNGYVHEAREVHRCLRAGELESPAMTLDETLALMRLMDAMRAEWGMMYPGEA